jgi:hypothetical protein
MSIIMDVSKWTKKETEERIKRYEYWSKQSDLSTRIIREMLNNPSINLALNLYSVPVKNAQWDIECEDESVSEYLTKAIESEYTSLCLGIKNALTYGYSAGEILYRYTNDGWILDGILDFKADDVLLEQDIYGNPFPVYEGYRYPVFKSFVVRYQYSEVYPYGISLLRPAYKSWHTSELANLAYARYLELKSGSRMMIKYPKTQGLDSDGSIEDPNKRLAMQIAQGFNDNKIIVTSSNTPDEAGWSIEEIGKVSDTDSYTSALDHYDRQILRGMLIPDRLVSNPDSTGSRSDQEGKQDMFYLILESIMEDFSTAITNRIIKPLLYLQYGKNDIRARFVFAPLMDSKRGLVDQMLLSGYSSGKIQIDSDWIKGQREINDGLSESNTNNVDNEVEDETE